MLKSRFRLVSLTLLLIFICSCATVGIGEDPALKRFLVVQKEVKHSLSSYKLALESQDEATQAEWHKKYDQPIRDMVAALNAWELAVTGISPDTGQMKDFMRLKNVLITLGWNYFKGGD